MVREGKKKKYKDGRLKIIYRRGDGPKESG